MVNNENAFFFLFVAIIRNYTCAIKYNYLIPITPA